MKELNENVRLKVLISAHELSPLLGSECSSGWNVITRLARHHDLTVIYANTNQFRTNNYKEHIENYISDNKIVGLEFIAVPQPRISKVIAYVNKFISHKKSNVGFSILYFMGVRFWEKKAFRKAKSILSKSKFHIIHHFNHLSYREPGYMWKLNLPFFWGPTSGLSKVPNSFLSSMPINEIIKNIFRNIVNSIQSLYSMKIRNAINKSERIYYVTSDDADYFLKRTKKGKYLLDIGTDYNEAVKEARINNNILEVLWVGRVDYLKALDILIKAIGNNYSLLKKIKLTIIGEGPQKERYQKMASQLKIENINWLGRIEKEKVYSLMKKSDVLVHTSIKEAASAVILESLSAGLPVICHDAFGMKYSINDKCGIKIPLISPNVSIVGFSQALESMINNPQKIKELKKGAIERSKELSWDMMAKEIAHDYYKYKKWTLKTGQLLSLNSAWI